MIIFKLLKTSFFVFYSKYKLFQMDDYESVDSTASSDLGQDGNEQVCGSSFNFGDFFKKKPYLTA